MITLGSTNTFQGKAGTAAQVTYTIAGMERVTGTLAEVYSVLGQGQLPNATAPLYTVTSGSSGFIRTIQLSNTGAAVLLNFYVNGTGAANQIISFTIPASGSAEFDSDGWKIRDSTGALVFSMALTLTGDVTGSGVGNIVTTLATVNGAPGSFGSATRSITATVNAKGLVTAMNDVLIQIAESQVTNLTTDLGLKADKATLINTTLPLTGGGDLSANRTLAINAAVGGATLTAGSQSGKDKLKEDNMWVDVQANPYAAAVLPSNSAATNRTNLLALFAAAPGGSTLFFPGGTYQFDQNMNVGAKTFAFQGNFGGAQLTGGYTILQIVTGTSGLITLTSGNWYTTFTNLIFAPATTQTSGNMVTVNDNVAVNFTACGFAALGGTAFNCIDYTGTGQSANTTVIDRCFMSGFTNFGVNVAADGASLVINNTVIQGQWGSTTQLAAACCNVVNAGALQIDNCDFIAGVNDLLLAPTAGKVIASVYMTNTYMDFSGGSCLKITGAGATVRCRFIAVSFTTANSFTNSAAVEISTTVTAGAQGIDFENCSVLNTFGTTGTTNGFIITGAADFSIIACRIAGWTNGIQITPFNSAGKTQPMITDNTIGPTAGFGGNSVGILLNAGAVTYGDTLIQNNILSGNTSAPITDNSTHTVTAFKIISGNAGHMSGAGALQALSSGGAARINERGAATSGAADTFLFTYRMPANSVLVGQKFKIDIAAQASTTGTTIFTIRGGPNGTIAGDTIISTHPVSAAAVANGYVMHTAIATVVALGATGNVAASGWTLSSTAASPSTLVGKTPAAEVIANAPTTAAWFITVSATHSTGVLTVREASCVAL